MAPRLSILLVIWALLSPVRPVAAELPQTAPNVSDQVCIAMLQPVSCELPQNLQQEAIQREADLLNQPQGGGPLGVNFMSRIVLADTKVVTDFVNLGTELQVDNYILNDLAMARTATFSHTLGLGYMQPSQIFIDSGFVPSNGFTTGANRDIPLASGQGWTATYTTTLRYTGLWFTRSYLDFHTPSFPPPQKMSLKGVWGLDIRTQVTNNLLSLTNPNTSPNGGNIFFYKVVAPAGVQVVGAMENGIATNKNIWDGAHGLYLAPASSGQPTAVFAAATAGTYPVTVEVRAGRIDWSVEPPITVPAELLYTKTVQMNLPVLDTTLPRLTFVPTEIDGKEGEVATFFVKLVREGNPTVPFTVTLDIGGMATEGQDYIFENLSIHSGTNVVNFRPNQSEMLIPIDLVDDTHVESPEGIVFLLKYEGQEIEIVGKGRLTVTIFDNDGPYELYLPFVVRN